jgi:hypothetical protein
MFRVGSKRTLHEYGIEPSQDTPVQNTQNMKNTEDEVNRNSCPYGSVRLSPKRTIYPFGIIPEAVQQKQNAKKMQSAAQDAEEVSTSSLGMNG